MGETKVKETVVCPDCGKDGLKNVGAHKQHCPANPEAVIAVKPGQRPGETIYSDTGRKTGKVLWTLQHCDEYFGTVEVIPDETLPVTFNGVMIQCFAGVSQLMPKCHADILEGRRKRIRRMANEHKEIVVSTGVMTKGSDGPLPPIE